MCFLVNNVTEVHQSFRITDINFTLFLVLFAKQLKMLSSLCKRALKYLSISLYLAIGVGYMWHTSKIWKWSPFPERRSFSLFRFCIFSFSHLSVLCVSPILPPYIKNRRPPPAERHSPPHPTDFLFSGSQHSGQVRSCTSKNLILCPTSQQTQVSTLVFKAFSQ